MLAILLSLPSRLAHPGLSVAKYIAVQDEKIVLSLALLRRRAARVLGGGYGRQPQELFFSGL